MAVAADFPTITEAVAGAADLDQEGLPVDLKRASNSRMENVTAEIAADSLTKGAVAEEEVLSEAFLLYYIDSKHFELDFQATGRRLVAPATSSRRESATVERAADSLTMWSLGFKQPLLPE